MGGMETTMLTGFQFQPNNPASATYLSQTTFQASGIANHVRLKQGEASASAAFGSPGALRNCGQTQQRQKRTHPQPVTVQQFGVCHFPKQYLRWHRLGQ